MTPRSQSLLAIASSLCLALVVPVAHADAQPPFDTELVLAGGSLGTCSELSPRNCREPLPERVGARGPALHRIDAAGIAAATEPALWQRHGAPRPADVRRMLRSIHATQPGPMTRAALSDALRDHPAWVRMDDDERAAVQAALEQAQHGPDGRARERVDPASSQSRGGLRVLEAFVASARARAGGRAPRIAFVTASAVDVFDPVDFYQGAFEALGAEAQWWPIDAAMAAAVLDGEGCAALPRLRVERLGLPARERVYPDLVDAQAAACANAQSVAELPLQVDGIFFAGGDQWRLRRAFVDTDDHPNAWLQALRRAHADGVVVGGTSAGAAVQSGAGMLSNGTPHAAITGGARVAAPPVPGCARAGRCPDGLDEDAFTWWPAGGTGLAADAVVDTHFSERARELRLLVLMQASGAALGLGADEASALRIRTRDGQRWIDAVGDEGGWVFVPRPGEPAAVDVFHLADGGRIDDTRDGWSLHGDAVQSCVEGAGATEGDTDADALEPGALRRAARTLARCGTDSVGMAAGHGSARLERDARTRVLVLPEGRVAVGPLRLHWAPGTEGDLPR